MLHTRHGNTRLQQPPTGERDSSRAAANTLESTALGGLDNARTRERRPLTNTENTRHSGPHGKHDEHGHDRDPAQRPRHDYAQKKRSADPRIDADSATGRQNTAATTGRQEHATLNQNGHPKHDTKYPKKEHVQDNTEHKGTTVQGMHARHRQYAQRHQQITDETLDARSEEPNHEPALQQDATHSKTVKTTETKVATRQIPAESEQPSAPSSAA